MILHCRRARKHTTLGLAIVTSAGLITVTAFAGVRFTQAPRTSGRSSLTQVCYVVDNQLVCVASPSALPDTVTVQ